MYKHSIRFLVRWTTLEDDPWRDRPINIYFLVKILILSSLFRTPPFFFMCDYSYSTDRKFALWQESSQILHDEIDVFTKINLLGGFKNYYLGSTARIMRIRCTHCLHVVWLMSNCSLWSTEAVHHCALLKNNKLVRTTNKSVYVDRYTRTVDTQVVIPYLKNWKIARTDYDNP